MRYYSTRGHPQYLNFTDTILKGLADDGGLYLPESWPVFTEREWLKMASLPYPELAAKVMKPFIGDAMTEKELLDLTQKSYAEFRHQAIAPLKQIDNQLFLMELFHGPTLAFKDFALQFLGNLFDFILERDDKTLTIIGATSGDTGSAALSAIAHKTRLKIFMLHPKGKISAVQEAQMTSVLADNSYNIALDGSFDDCQDLVKVLFNDEAFRQEMNLSAVNSINWARIMAQIVYYAYGCLRLGLRDCAVAVPSGNFGNIFAAWAGRKMGLPIKKLIIGSNCNDILTRTVHSGLMEMRPVIPSVAPSMDIQISSNFERLLYELLGRDSASLTKFMDDFRKNGTFTLPETAKKELQSLFVAHAIDDETIGKKIAHYHRITGNILDPHSVIGVEAGKIHGGDLPVIAVATAHPAKFPDIIKKSINIYPELPAHLHDLMTRPTQCHELPDNSDAIKKFMRNHCQS